jgi:outer membrane protein TolC
MMRPETDTGGFEMKSTSLRLQKILRPGVLPAWRPLLAMAGALLILAQAALAEPVDLDEYLDLVVENSRALKLADRDRSMARARKREATSAALPHIVAEAGYVRNFTDTYMYVDPSALGSGEDNGDVDGEEGNGSGEDVKLKINRSNEFSAGAALSQVIFNPSVFYAIKGAKQYEELTDFVYDSSYQNIITQAKRLFYQGVLLEKVWEVRVSAEDSAHDNYLDIKKKYDNGMVSEFQLLQAEVRWKNAIPDTSQARRDYELVLNNLKTLAGIPVREDLSLLVSMDDYPELPDSLDLEAVLARRPDYNSLLIEEKLNETSVKANKSAYFPTLNGSLLGAYSAQSDEWELEQDNTVWSGSLTLSLPLFLGGSTRARVQQARIGLEKSQLRVAQARDDIYNEIASIYLWMKEARGRIESAEATLRSAERAFSIAETTSRSGLTTQLELKDARLGLDEASLNRYLAIYDYLAAYFEWERATGEIGSVLPAGN